MRIRLLLCLLSLNLAIAGEPARLQFTRIGPTRIGLFLANADGSNERALLPADSLDYTPSFSTDGKWIVFTSERGGSADIYRVHPDGSGLERLTDDPAFDDQGALSPDGSTLAFVSTREGGFANLWLQDLSSPSRHARPIAKTNAGSFRPSWSPDGKWIAFTSDRDTRRARWDGGWELIQSTALYIVRADGSSLRRLTELGELRRVAAMESGRAANRVLPVDTARRLPGAVWPQPAFGIANRVDGCGVGCGPRVYFRPRIESRATVAAGWRGWISGKVRRCQRAGFRVRQNRCARRHAKSVVVGGRQDGGIPEGD